MRKHNYVVGYEDGVIYDMDGDCIDPMSFEEAREEVKRLYNYKNFKRTIYKLVPVKTID